MTGTHLLPFLGVACFAWVPYVVSMAYFIAWGLWASRKWTRPKLFLVMRLQEMPGYAVPIVLLSPAVSHLSLIATNRSVSLLSLPGILFALLSLVPVAWPFVASFGIMQTDSSDQTGTAALPFSACASIAHVFARSVRVHRAVSDRHLPVPAARDLLCLEGRHAHQLRLVQAVLCCVCGR